MNQLRNSLSSAVDWLTGPGTVKDNTPVGEHGAAFGYTHWNGAIRGEYLSWTKQWNSFCPIWHTGQAVKALVLASKALQNPDLLKSAEFNASFIMNQQIKEGPDTGLILAFEDYPNWVNTSAILECVDGLFLLTEATQDAQYRETALHALNWVAEHSWQQSEKLFWDLYDPVNREFIFNVRGSQNRPLLDDAVFLKAWKYTGDIRFREIAYGTADTLLANENPAGNWIKYGPCNAQRGNIHPRHAFWWGLPMLDLYLDSGDKKYFDLFLRSAEWYRNAVRRDGGLFRDTYEDYSTPSFGHATSGSACAAIVFEHAYIQTKNKDWLEYAERPLAFCQAMQLTHPEDSMLCGAIMEKVLPPDGTEHIPFQLRDLGTIFFIQAAAKYLLTIEGK